MVDVRALDSYTCIEENTCFKNKGQLHSTLQFTWEMQTYHNMLYVCVSMDAIMWCATAGAKGMLMALQKDKLESLELILRCYFVFSQV